MARFFHSFTLFVVQVVLENVQKQDLPYDT